MKTNLQTMLSVGLVAAATFIMACGQGRELSNQRQVAEQRASSSDEVVVDTDRASADQPASFAIQTQEKSERLPSFGTSCNPNGKLFTLEVIRSTPRGFPGILRATSTTYLKLPADAKIQKAVVRWMTYDDRKPEAFFISPVAGSNVRSYIMDWAVSPATGPATLYMNRDISFALNNYASVVGGQKVYRIIGGVDDLGGGNGNWLQLKFDIDLRFTSASKNCTVSQMNDYWNAF